MAVFFMRSGRIVGMKWKQENIDAAKAMVLSRMAFDFPGHEIGEIRFVAYESARVVVRVYHQPNGPRLLPGPSSLYAVVHNCSSCVRLEGTDAEPYN
jgi:hypothetical protein